VRILLALVFIFGGLYAMGMDRLVPYVVGLLVVAWLCDQGQGPRAYRGPQ
jgi:hypothetical protein